MPPINATANLVGDLIAVSNPNAIPFSLVRRSPEDVLQAIRSDPQAAAACNHLVPALRHDALARYKAWDGKKPPSDFERFMARAGRCLLCLHHRQPCQLRCGG
jgi:hypothetical protein